MHFPKLSQIALLDEVAHHLVTFEAVGAGDDLGHELGSLLCSSQHAMGLGGIHAHPGFGEHVLTGIEGAQRDGAMQVRPGADDNGIDVRARHDFFPVMVDVDSAQLMGHGGGGFGPAVAHGHNRDVRTRKQPRNVPQTRVGASADQSHSQRCPGHDAFPW